MARLSVTCATSTQSRAPCWAVQAMVIRFACAVMDGCTANVPAPAAIIGSAAASALPCGDTRVPQNFTGVGPTGLSVPSAQTTKKFEPVQTARGERNNPGSATTIGAAIGAA